MVPAREAVCRGETLSGALGRELVTVALDVRLPPRVYKADKRTIATSIWLRN